MQAKRQIVRIAFGNGHYEFFNPFCQPWRWPPLWQPIPWAGCYAPKGVPVAQTPEALRDFFDTLPEGITLEIFAHGNPDTLYATFCDSRQEAVIHSSDIPAIFEPLKARRPSAVILHACEVAGKSKRMTDDGARQDNFAQTLSQYLQIKVYGPPFVSRGTWGFYRRYDSGKPISLSWHW